MTENLHIRGDGEDNNKGDSIKSASSYDASKISFQGKRALFEAGNIPIRGHRPSSVTSKCNENLVTGTVTSTANLTQLEETNSRLEEDVVRLEQAAALREEVARRLREKVERLESQAGEREGELQGDIRRLARDNSTKEEIIQ